MFLVEIFMINKSRNAKQPCATRFIIFNRPTYLLTHVLKAWSEIEQFVFFS